MNKYQPQSPQRPPRFFWAKIKNENDSKEIDSSLLFDPPGKKERGGTKRRRRAQRRFLKKTWVVLIFLHPAPEHLVFFYLCVLCDLCG